MSSIDQKRMLKLAGLLKEGLEEWPRGLAEDEKDVPVADVGPTDLPMGYAPGESEYSKRDEMESVYSDMYKELNGFRPRRDLSHLSDDDLQNMIDNLQADIDMSIEDNRWEDKVFGKEAEKEEAIKELEPSAEEEELERMPKSIGMGRGASLEETYIDNMKEVIHRLVHQVFLEKAKSYKGKSMRLGGGGRFAKMVDSLKKSGKSEEQARAIAYKAGVKKYGKGKMTKMAAAGKKRKKD